MLDVEKFIEIIHKCIADAEQFEARTENQRRRMIVRNVARELDDLIKFPNTAAGRIAEMIDGPLLIAVGHLIGSLVDGELIKLGSARNKPKDADTKKPAKAHKAKGGQVHEEPSSDEPVSSPS